MLSSRATLTIGALLAFGATAARAQDAHYWSLQYGPVGQLLGGTTVGGVNDLSASYYNPGALALIDDPRFLLSFDTFQISSLQVENGAGPGLDLTNRNIRSIPRIVAGEFKLGATGDDRLAYSILTRQQAEFNFQTSGSNITSPPGQNERAALARLDQRITEYWAGGTWSRKLSENWGIGSSMYLGLRNQRSRTEVITESISETGSNAFIYTDDFSYTHFRLLWKVGASYRDGPLRVGATLTTPGLGLGGYGSTTLNTSRVGTNVDATLAAGVQKNLSTDYRSPTSAALGASYHWKNTAIHASTEWFQAVAPYEVLSPEPFPVAGSDETLYLPFTRHAKSVVNFGLGVEHTFETKDYGLYASLFRDHSSVQPDSLDAIASWDLTHVRGGFTFGTSSVQWALGAGLAWGEDDVPRLEAPDPDPMDSARAKFKRVNIFFAFAFGS